MTEGFQVGAWYWCSDGNKWKIKAVFSNFVLARRRYRLYAEAFFFGEDGSIHLDFTIDSKWKVE